MFLKGFTVSALAWPVTEGLAALSCIGKTFSLVALQYDCQPEGKSEDSGLLLALQDGYQGKKSGVTLHRPNQTRRQGFTACQMLCSLCYAILCTACRMGWIRSSLSFASSLAFRIAVGRPPKASTRPILRARFPVQTLPCKVSLPFERALLQQDKNSIYADRLWECLPFMKQRRRL